MKKSHETVNFCYKKSQPSDKKFFAFVIKSEILVKVSNQDENFCYKKLQPTEKSH